jgi:biotin synthase
MLINELKQRVLRDEGISKGDALQLVKADLEELCEAANEIRKKFCGDEFEICTIINAKSGRCSENCKFCAQSAHYKVDVEKYPLMDSEQILSAAKHDDDAGVQRFSPVTSGRRLTKSEIESLRESVKKIKANTNLKVCASCGLLDSDDLQKLKECTLQLAELAEKQDAAEAALAQARGKAHEKLNELKNIYEAVKFPVKSHFAMEQWPVFGIADKR